MRFHLPPPKPKPELRKFGFIMTVPLLLLAAWSWWKGGAAWPYLVGAAGVLAVLALAAPVLLRWPERLWMGFAEVLGYVMTRVILTGAFFLAILPIGLVLRLTGKDLLALRLDPGRASYWEPVEEDGPATRPGKPY